jgi:general transcription factor IIIA
MKQFSELPSDIVTSGTNDHSLQRAIYPDTTCATCQVPLDTSERLLNIVHPDLLCTRDKSHLSTVCHWCGKRFIGLKKLKQHSTWHPILQCIVPGCEERLSPWEVAYHFQLLHPEIKWRCSQCGLQADSQSQLDEHGERTMHGAYVCQYPDCGSESSRMGDLNRHQLTHKKDVPRYRCHHCRK